MQILIDISEHEWEYLNKLVANGDQLGHYERLLVNGELIVNNALKQDNSENEEVQNEEQCRNTNSLDKSQTKEKRK